MGLFYGRAGRLNTKNGGFRPGQGDDQLLACKSVAAVLVLVAFLKAAQFFQAFPGLGRLVQVAAAGSHTARHGIASASLWRLQ